MCYSRIMMTAKNTGFKIPTEGWVSFESLVKNRKVRRVRFPVGSVLELEVPFEEYVFDSETGQYEFKETTVSYVLVGNGGPVGVLVDVGSLTEGEGQISFLKYKILRWNPFISTGNVEIEFEV